jgi:D-alanyl-D-alanine carboxypeptidase
VVFTGPADHPDPVVAQTASATPKKKKKTAAKTEGSEKPVKGAAAEKPKKTDDAKPAKAAKPAKQTKPKVTSSTQ